MNTNQKKVINYYHNLESRLGYDILLWGSKHFGYYPTGKADISEKQAQNLFHELVAKKLELKANQLILDAGCGQGVVSTYLAKHYHCRIVGITLVDFEVEKSKAKARQLGVVDLTNYQLMDYSHTSFPDNYFDAIYTTETLSHSPDIRQTLREFLRILKPKGKIALFEYTIAPDSDFSEYERKILNLVIEGSAMMGLKDFRHNQFTEVIKEVGFENVEEENISENMHPSFYRLQKLSIWSYRFIKLLGLQKFFINTTAGYEFYKMADKGVIVVFLLLTNQKTYNYISALISIYFQ